MTPERKAELRAACNCLPDSRWPDEFWVELLSEALNEIDRLSERASGRNHLAVAIIEPYGGFCGTWNEDSYTGAERQAETYDLIIRPFGVNLKTVGAGDPPRAMIWEKVEGWSTWAPEK